MLHGRSVWDGFFSFLTVPVYDSIEPFMNIHEYQAKALLEKFGVAVPKGVAVRSLAEFEPALVQFPEGSVVVKAQLHAGGRGKGTFTDGFQGGVKIARSRAEALEYARKMLGNTLVTAQTGPAGRRRSC